MGGGVQLAAPDAQQVGRAGELDGKPHPLTKGANGVWTVKIGPLAPDIYTYAFNVDGVDRARPAQHQHEVSATATSAAVSVVQVPGDAPQFYDVKAGAARRRAHPAVHVEDDGRRPHVWIYTPPDYDKGRDFPVLYLLHGAGDIESGWTMIGRANNILDNLIAERQGQADGGGDAARSRHTELLDRPGKAVADPVAVVRARSLDDIIAAMMSGDGKGGLSLFAQRPGRGRDADGRADLQGVQQARRSSDRRSVDGRRPDDEHRVQPAGTVQLCRVDERGGGAAARGNLCGLFKDIAAANKRFKLFWTAVGKDDTLTGPGDNASTTALRRAASSTRSSETDGRHEWTVWRYHCSRWRRCCSVSVPTAGPQRPPTRSESRSREAARDGGSAGCRQSGSGHRSIRGGVGATTPPARRRGGGRVRSIERGAMRAALAPSRS